MLEVTLLGKLHSPYFCFFLQSPGPLDWDISSIILFMPKESGEIHMTSVIDKSEKCDHDRN